MKDLREQLKNLFPNHIEEEVTTNQPNIWMQDEPLHCKYEKRKGKPVTIIERYQGTDTDFKILAREIKTLLGVGGAFKDGNIIVQGDYREKIMQFLKEKGFKVKRVGG